MTEITLSHGDARATIALLGAEARQWRIAGRDLLWPGDPAIWSDISPILYPVVGWTRDGEERVDGVTYKLGLHGFARFETFAVESSGPDFARLALSDNARTRAVYPFAFALAIEYRLTDEALSIAIEVANPGHKRAPYACGLHPGFRWPFGAAGRAGALVQFAKNERPEVPELAPGRSCPRDHAVDPALRPQPAAVGRPVRARRAVLPRLQEPVAGFPRRLRGVDHHGIRKLPARRAVDKAARAVPLPRGLDRLQRPGRL